MTIEIVPVKEAHIEGYWQCLDSVAKSGNWLSMKNAPPLESSRRFVLSVIENNDIQFVAMDGETVVGWIDIERQKREVFQHVGTLGMGILESYRQQGIGSRLMQAALDKARENGLLRVELEVFDFNTGAIALYKKFGFEHEGQRNKVGYYPDMGYVDLLLMYVWLGTED